MAAEEIRLSMPWGVVALKCWNSCKLHPMLMVHGARDNAATFDALIPLLPKDHYYVCVDLPGHGLSDGLVPGLPPSYMHYVGVLLRVIWHFKWESYSLLGHSLGAHLVLALAVVDIVTLKLRKVVLLDGILRYPAEREVYLESFRNEMHWIIKLDEQWHHRKPTTYDQIFQKLTANNTENAVRAYLNRFPAKSDDDFAESPHSAALFTTKSPFTEEVTLYMSEQVECPVLVVFARDSHLMPVHSGYDLIQKVIENLKKSNPLTRVEYVDGTHTVHAKCPENVAAVMVPFLRDVDESLKQKAKL